MPFIENVDDLMLLLMSEQPLRKIRVNGEHIIDKEWLEIEGEEVVNLITE